MAHHSCLTPRWQLSACLGLILTLPPAQAQAPAPPTIAGTLAPATTLTAMPEKDMFSIVEVMYSGIKARQGTAHTDVTKSDLELAMERYSEFIQSYPASALIPQALHRIASINEELGRHADALRTYEAITQRCHGTYAASAAYTLALEATKNKDWQTAERYFLVVQRQADKDDLKVDTAYRLARVYLAQDRKEQARERLSYVANHAKSPLNYKQLARIALASILANEGKEQESLKEYQNILADTQLDANNRGATLLAAAALSSKLGQDAEADKYYQQVVKNPVYSKQAGDVHMAVLSGLNQSGRSKKIIEFDQANPTPTTDPILTSKAAMIVGNAMMMEKDYDKAKEKFYAASRLLPETSPLSIDSLYRYLLCLYELKSNNLAKSAQNFLNAYARSHVGNPILDQVRLMAAEALFDDGRPVDAAEFYKSINFDFVDPKIRGDIMYKAAVALSKAGKQNEALQVLTAFQDQFPKDSKLPYALVLRGDISLQFKREAEALADFDLVIKNWPKHETSPVAWQRSAQIYFKRQDLDSMTRCYSGLITNFPNAPAAALSEAKYMLGRAFYERKEYSKSVEHLNEAKTLNPTKYADSADGLLTACYYQLKDAKTLKTLLEEIRERNVALFGDTPEVIAAWLGMELFRAKDYDGASLYLTMATKSGEVKEDKKVLWKTMARARFYQKTYELALRAVNKYLEAETHPIRRAEALLDKAAILLKTDKLTEAKEAATEALNQGAAGPLMVSIKIALGDIALAEKNYDEAANYYVTMALFSGNDQELKPIALYKAAEASEKANRLPDATKYRTQLSKEFPQWTPQEASKANTIPTTSF